MTENDVLRERLEKIADLAGRRVRIDSLENRLHAALEDNAALQVDLDRVRAALRAVVDKGRAVPLAEEYGMAGVSAVFPRGEWERVVLAPLNQSKEQV